jgi:chromosome segregation ATPase
MSAVDTNREAVERLADEVQTIRWPLDEGCKLREDAAATLRALLAERDALARALAAKEAAAQDALQQAWEERDAAIESGAEQLVLVAELRDQLDAARAEVARLREVLEGIAEYWNGAEGSAVDAAEECRYRADAALAEPTP